MEEGRREVGGRGGVEVCGGGLGRWVGGWVVSWGSGPKGVGGTLLVTEKPRKTPLGKPS